eukprot:1254769-Prymnesium_polylepis.1
MKPMRSLTPRASGSSPTVTAQHVHTQPQKTWTVGGSASQLADCASVGKSSSRFISCTGYIASSTVAATFHDGGGGTRSLWPAVARPSRGSQPPREPSSFCSVIFSASTSTDRPSRASPRATPLESHSLRCGLCRQTARSESLVKTMATVSDPSP